MATLTVEDRLELHELYARFAHAYDFGDVDGWVAVFTPDGVFEMPAGPVTGSAELRAFATRRREEAPGTLHMTTNVMFDGTEAGANGHAYILCYRISGDEQLRLLNIGRYEDELVRTVDGWRLAVRRVLSETPDAIRDAPFVFAPARSV